MEKGERSFQFKENYMSLRAEGKSVKEIAEKYLLSRRYGYVLVHELADEMGVDYNILIDRPHRKHTMTKTPNTVKPVKRVDVSKLEKEIRKGISESDKLMSRIKKYLKECKKVESLEV